MLTENQELLKRHTRKQLFLLSFALVFVEYLPLLIMLELVSLVNGFHCRTRNRNRMLELQDFFERNRRHIADLISSKLLEDYDDADGG